MKYHSYSPVLAQLHGKKPSWVDRFISMRSDLSHTEIQFSDRYGGISFSATMADDCKCARFKMIGYKHPERWLTTPLQVTDEQEDAIFKKCCEMADVSSIHKLTVFGIQNTFFEDMDNNRCFFGPNALKYDLAQVSFGFISKLRIKRGDKMRVFCTEAVYIALMEVWPEILSFVPDSFKKDPVMKCCVPYRLDPDELTPSTGDDIIRNHKRKCLLNS